MATEMYSKTESISEGICDRLRLDIYDVDYYSTPNQEATIEDVILSVYGSIVESGTTTIRNTGDTPDELIASGETKVSGEISGTQVDGDYSFEIHRGGMDGELSFDTVTVTLEKA